MQVEVVDLLKGTKDDPAGADYWLALRHTNYHSVKHSYISWEVPVTKSELESLLNVLPKKIKAIAAGLGFSV